MRHITRTLLVFYVLLAVAGCRRDATARANWDALPLGTTADFGDLWFSDARHGWIVGGSYQIPGGLIGHTDDGGRTWRFNSNLLGTPTGAGQMSVLAVHFFDSRRGLVTTSSGAILSTTDGGENWARVSRQGRGGAVSNVFFLDDRLGWAVGLRGVLRTDDTGQQWVPASTDETTATIAGRAIHFLDDRNGWLAGMHASLMHTADGGLTWESIATPFSAEERPGFWDLFFVDSQFGWVVGEDGTIVATRDGGATWLLQHTGLADAHSAPKLERIPRAGRIDVIDAGDRTPGLTLRSVRFVDRDRGWIVGYYAGLGRSLILRTEDGGGTWAVDADIAGEELHALFVQDGERLWTVGARVREGAQAIYQRAVAAAPASPK